MTVDRTAFLYTQAKTGSLGDGLKHGINQVCPCCKGGGTSGGRTIGQVDRIVDLVELKPFTDFYDSKPDVSEFNAYHCHSCGYEWSWYKLTQPHAALQDGLDEFNDAPRRIVSEHEATEASLTLPFIPVDLYTTAIAGPREVGCLVREVRITYELDGHMTMDRLGTRERLFLAEPAVEEAQE